METGKFMNENCYRYAHSSFDNERVRWEQSLTPENLHFKFFLLHSTASLVGIGGVATWAARSLSALLKLVAL